MSKNTENPESNKISKLEEKVACLQEQVETIFNLKNKWEECARHYADKFQTAYKGFLMTQGVPEFKAQQESEKVLDKLRSCD
jgi:hypothetical protein